MFGKKQSFALVVKGFFRELWFLIFPRKIVNSNTQLFALKIIIHKLGVGLVQDPFFDFDKKLFVGVLGWLFFGSEIFEFQHCGPVQAQPTLRYRIGSKMGAWKNFYTLLFDSDYFLKVQRSMITFRNSGNIPDIGTTFEANLPMLIPNGKVSH